MKKQFSKAMAVILSAIMLFGLFVTANAADVKKENVLRLNQDGKFKIMHICDIQDDISLKPIVKTFLNDVLDAQKPDLVVLGGDNISGGSCTVKSSGKTAIKNFMSIFQKHNVPVLVCFGNHDAEGALTKEEMLKIYQDYDCCLSVDDGELSGCATNSTPVYFNDNDRVALNLYTFDSNMYVEDELGGYDFVHKDQVDWYKAQRDALYEKEGRYVPSLVFQHIIVPQVFDAMTEVEKGTEGAFGAGDKFFVVNDSFNGEVNETPCPPNIKRPEGYAELNAMLEHGEVMGMFFGHDHVNSFSVDFQGVDLVNTPGMGFYSYGDKNRGVRIITFDQANPTEYETEMVTYLDFYKDSPMMLNQFVASGDEHDFFARVKAAFTYLYLKLLSLFGIAA